jgi:hypothetical protein
VAVSRAGAALLDPTECRRERGDEGEQQGDANHSKPPLSVDPDVVEAAGKG